MTLKFVPPKNVARYAYAVEFTKSQTRFNTYDQLGSAKNALQHKVAYTGSDFKTAYILENVDGEWFVLHTVTKEDLDNHEFPWRKEIEKGSWRNPYKVKEARPMTRDEYADWRVAVERERIAGARLSHSL